MHCGELRQVVAAKMHAARQYAAGGHPMRTATCHPTFALGTIPIPPANGVLCGVEICLTYKQPSSKATICPACFCASP